MSSARSRRSADRSDTARALDDAVTALREAVRASSSTAPVVLIDGRSGAGKSTIAAGLVAVWPGAEPVQLIALDSIYPGWDGLDAGVRTVTEQVLLPHANGRTGRWHRFDWDRHAYAEAYAVDPDLPLIVEGSGLLTERTAALGTIRVWVDAPDRARKTRALTRDGALFRAHWEQWATQEVRHLDRDRPERLASTRLRVP